MAALGALVVTAPAQASFAPEGSPLAVGRPSRTASDRGLQPRRPHRRRPPSTAPGATSRCSSAGPRRIRGRAGLALPDRSRPGLRGRRRLQRRRLSGPRDRRTSATARSACCSARPAAASRAGTPLTVGSTGSVTAADFNGDGRPGHRRAELQRQATSSSTRQANGSGGFMSEGTNPTGATPRDIAAADFNGDGLPDLAISNLNGGTVTVLLRNAQQRLRVGGRGHPGRRARRRASRPPTSTATGGRPRRRRPRNEHRQRAAAQPGRRLHAGGRRSRSAPARSASRPPTSTPTGAPTSR